MRCVALLLLGILTLVGCGEAGEFGQRCDNFEGVADYFGSTGSFESAEAALRSVVDSETEDLPPVDEYRRKEFDHNRVDFIYEVEGAEHHRWEIVRGEDDQWQVMAQSGCLTTIG